MWFLLIGDELLEKKPWNLKKKVRNSIKKEFDSEPAYDEKYLRTKIKSCKAKINTNFLIINNKGRLTMYLFK